MDKVKKSVMNQKECETALDRSIHNVAKNHSSILENFIEAFLATRLEEKLRLESGVIDRAAYLKSVFESCELCFSEPEYDKIQGRMIYKCWIQPKVSKPDGLQPSKNSVSSKTN